MWDRTHKEHIKVAYIPLGRYLSIKQINSVWEFSIAATTFVLSIIHIGVFLYTGRTSYIYCSLILPCLLFRLALLDLYFGTFLCLSKEHYSSKRIFTIICHQRSTASVDYVETRTLNKPLYQEDTCGY